MSKIAKKKTAKKAAKKVGKSEHVAIPFRKEWDDIAKDLNQASYGVIAWVRAGMRLIDVKNRLPHGQFMSWVDSNLPRVANLSLRHLTRAKQVAEDLLIANDLLLEDAAKVAGNCAHALWKSIEGQSTRQLTLTVQELRSDATEEASKDYCEKAWAKSAKKRDDWEPRVLSGELTYYQAKSGMMGREATKGKEKKVKPAFERISRNLNGLKQNLADWETMSEKASESAMTILCEVLEKAPESVRQAISKHLSD